MELRNSKKAFDKQRCDDAFSIYVLLKNLKRGDLR
jgi:hypothetical protein